MRRCLRLRCVVSSVLSVAVILSARTIPADDAAPTSAQAQSPVERTLRAWQQAAVKTRVPGRVLEKQLRKEYGKNYSAHELAVLKYFSGPVDPGVLRERYSWQAGPNTDGLQTLVATPLEATDRLFFREFEVAFDVRSGLPIAVEFRPHAGRPAPALPVLFAFRSDVDLPAGILLAHARHAKPLRTVELNTHFPVAGNRVHRDNLVQPAAAVDSDPWFIVPQKSAPREIHINARPLQQQPARAAKATDLY